ncbi:MAG: hypothetical protein ABI632_11330 [Pseudolysinimonas sp.]
MTLLDAAYRLDEISVGWTSDHGRLLSSAPVLGTRRLMGTADQNPLRLVRAARHAPPCSLP